MPYTPSPSELANNYILQVTVSRAGYLIGVFGGVIILGVLLLSSIHFVMRNNRKGMIK